jgi:hypothetical protein
MGETPLIRRGADLEKPGAGSGSATAAREARVGPATTGATEDHAAKNIGDDVVQTFGLASLENQAVTLA